MKLLPTLLSTLSAVATIVGGSASAYEVHKGIGFYTPDDFTGAHADIVEGLNKMEIPVVDGSTIDGACEAKPGMILYGFYNPQMNVMVLCKEGLSQKDIEETLTHEAVHVIQDMRAGISNSEMEVGNVLPLFRQLSVGSQQNILQNYDKSDWDLEVEAFYYESKPEAVAEAFRF